MVFFIIALISLVVPSIQAAPSFLGASACQGCHLEAFEQWQGSHHDLAMQIATPQTVLGNFDNVSHKQYGVISTFFREGDRFFVKTEGETGALQVFEIKNTFCVFPLQQYLIDFENGRKQALSIAWDSRALEEGGQRWFHLYPDEQITFEDELHWTKPSQNWNSACAECHSTNFKKNYDVESGTFNSSWAEINVSCESCHGPGSKHVAWAKQEPGWLSMQESLGLVFRLDERNKVFWHIDPVSDKPLRSAPKLEDVEIETCARCHSLRSSISKKFVHGERLMDHYYPQNLVTDSYHVDGQIDGEVYVYGSFRQSKMYQAGVTCSDCHDPHSNEMKLPGNDVCLQCHQSEIFSQVTHHFHDRDSRGSICVDCHMPTKDYMVIDSRRDHSIRVPRPDLSQKIGTPNACTNCHSDKEAEWAADKVRSWYGENLKGFQDFSFALSAARSGKLSSRHQLVELIRDLTSPAIARATGFIELGRVLTEHDSDLLSLGLSDDDPAVRTSAVSILDRMPLDVSAVLAAPMLRDPVRMVRTEAARVLAGVAPDFFNSSSAKFLSRAEEEYIAAQMAGAERSESWTNLGNFYSSKREWSKAIEVYRRAISLNPLYVPAYANLSDVYRVLKDEDTSEKVLRDGLVVDKGNATLHHALGLSLIRQNRVDQALLKLKLAAELTSTNPRFVYVYAIALNSLGKISDAISVLTEAHDQYSSDQEILQALITSNRKMGRVKMAKLYADRLAALRD